MYPDFKDFYIKSDKSIKYTINKMIESTISGIRNRLHYTIRIFIEVVMRYSLYQNRQKY